MNRRYICKGYENLEEGEEILAFGVHVLRWNFEEWGNPAYGFVEDKETENQESFEKDLQSISTELHDVAIGLREVTDNIANSINNILETIETIEQ